MDMNRIYLRRRRKVHMKDEIGSTPLNHIATLQKNIEPLGFAFSPRLLERLQTMPSNRFETFAKLLIDDLREMVGAHRPFKPMYPNFPRQVMEMSEARLYLNAFLHYDTNELPAYEKQARPSLLEETEYRVIDLGSKADFETIFTRLVASNTSISKQDKEDVAWFITQYRDGIGRLLPASIPSRENLAFVVAQLIRDTSLSASALGDKLTTATDILRVAVAMSGGDVSLATATKFAKFRRRERVWLLSYLETFGNVTEDMLRWPEPWKRLGERLHPGDYAAKYPKTLAAFRVVRNAEHYSTFLGKLEKELSCANIAASLELLSARPGDYARRLDHLLRISQANPVLLERFASVVDRVSTSVLLQVMTHFRNRNNRRPLRSFFPKGEVGKVYAIPDRLAVIPEETCRQVAQICEKSLIQRFAKLAPLGKCYLDPDLANYLVPFSQRSAAKSLRTLVRGSRIPLPSAKVVRFFLWWRNGRSRTDIDLSAAIYDGDFNYIDVLAYYNLRNFGGHHSGDIVDAPNGAAEFIDLDVEQLKAAGVRYVVMSLNSFTAQPYCDLPECFAGWMARQSANSGEIFEPRTVEDKIDLATNTAISIPAVLDLTERKVIWADIALRCRPRFNNVNNNLSGISLMTRAICSLVKTDLHTLFELHVKARGTFTENPTAADSLFSLKAGITPFELDRIAAEFLQ